MSEEGSSAGGALGVWREKRAEYERELAISADPPRQFELRKLIEQCNREITRLEAEPGASSEQPIEESSVQAPRWNVPVPANPFFTGRERILRDVKSTLEATGAAALSGLGGVGKTQTAARYAHQHRDEYKAVLWASAASREALGSDFVAIAGLLELPVSPTQEQALTVVAVKRWMETNSGWLLILDNADDLTAVKEFIPPSRQGHLLLTTQAWATGGIARPIEVDVMEPDEGALFLLRRANPNKDYGTLADATEGDRWPAKQLSAELGGLPLALDQAGAYIDETGCGLASYVGLYRRQAAELLQRRGGVAPDHASVAATFTLSFTNVRKASAAAAEILSVCAFLDPDAIPEEILTSGADALGPILSPTAADPLKLDSALGEARRYSLLRRKDGMLNLHRLVQHVIHDGMKEEEKRQWAERAVRAVNLVFPYIEYGNWSLCERLLPHVIACVTLTSRFGFEFEEAARLLSQGGYYLHERGRFSDVEPLHRRALSIWEKALGPDHPDVAASLSNLAGLCMGQGKHAEAEPLFQRALAIREKALGPEHPDVAASLNNLAGLSMGQGKYTQAEPLLQRALAIREKALGPDHPHVANGLNSLAALYHAQRKYTQAEPLFRRALAIREKALGPDHPDVATSLNNLAGLYDAQGKYAPAEPLYQGALSIWERILSPDHPNVATSLNNLAALYHAQRRYGEAEPLLQRALAIREKALGPDHPDVATSLNNLAELYQAQREYGRAEPLLRRALAILEKALGPGHPDVAAILENYAVLLRKTNREAEAEPLEARARAIRAKHAQENPGSDAA